MKSGFIRRIPARTSPIGTHGQLQEPETGANDAPASMSSTSGLACWLGGFLLDIAGVAIGLGTVVKHPTADRSVST
jgi:hypothetical protein